MRTLPYTAFAASDNFRDAFRAYLLAIALAVPSLWLLLHYQLSILFFLITAGIFCLAWPFSKSATILALFWYLFLLGDIRRLSTLVTGNVRLDPLLIVGPLFTIFVTIPIFLKLRVGNAFSKAVLALTIMLSLEIFNPRQGSIVIGLSGAMFLLIPIVWFWIARSYATDRMLYLLIFRTLIPIGVLAAFLGLYQTYVGFLPWEEAWIQRAVASGYTALDLGNGHIRSFGFSVNSVEYGTLLMLANICVIAAVWHGKRAYALLLPLLFPALILASQRSVILKLLIGVAALWAVRGRNAWAWAPRILIGGVAAIALLIFAGRSAGDSSAGGGKGSTANLATNHVAKGFAHPLDSHSSTLGTHSTMVFRSIASGFTNPLGSGLGSVTLGAAKFGADAGTFGSSEVDVSDVFAASGFIGGFFYVFTIGLGLFSCGKLVLARPDIMSYALVGILASMIGAWIPLGQYATGPLLWFCLGYLAQERVPIQQASLVSEPDYLREAV